MYAKDPPETRYQILINKRESPGLTHFDDPKAFIEYSNDTQDVHKNIDKCNIDNKRKILIVFDDMIADMINNKKLNSVVTDLIIKHFSCFYYAIILLSSKRLNSGDFLYHENSK